MDIPPSKIVEVLVTIPFDETLMAQIREVSPRVRLNTVTARRPEDISPDLLQRAEVLYTDRVLPAPERVPNLKWVQFHYAGVDFALDSALLRKPGLVATTLSGAAAPQAAEFAITMMLALGRRLWDLRASQEKCEWPRDRWERFQPVELRGSTVGLVGYGSIGRELARMLQAFQVTVLAAKRDVMHIHDDGYLAQGLGDPNGDLFTRLYPIQALRSMLKICDFVVVSLPLTTATRGLFGADEFAAMKSSAYLVDLGRGGVVDHAALLAALQEKRIGGAALDVFPEEPLPPTSPLWKMPNVMITPHIAGISPLYNKRAIDLFTTNLQRYLDGSPVLNIVNLEKGY
ncbi:MAG TPA: D-2-hydroxyacid dehydrogenase [Anaerolineaceae bacterium]